MKASIKKISTLIIVALTIILVNTPNIFAEEKLTEKQKLQAFYEAHKHNKVSINVVYFNKELTDIQEVVAETLDLNNAAANQLFFSYLNDGVLNYTEVKSNNEPAYVQIEFKSSSTIAKKYLPKDAVIIKGRAYSETLGN